MVGNLLVVFGGTASSEGGSFTYFDDVWALDTDTATSPLLNWTSVSATGSSKPSARYGHAATVVGTRVYVFGGRGERGAVFNDLWALDVNTWAWSRLPSSSAPPSPRFGHSLTAVGGRLVVFGGWDGHRANGEIWVFDEGTLSWSRPRVGGTPPRARQGHAGALDARAGRLLIWGGVTYTGLRGGDAASAALSSANNIPEYLRDTVELDLVSMTWARPRVTGDFPTARAAGACATLANVLVLFGGWCGPAGPPQSSTEPTTVTLTHRPGMGFGTTAPPRSVVQVPYGPHAGTSLLDLDSGEWVTPHVAGTPPGYRYGSSACARGLRLYMFGGWQDSKPLSELLVLDLGALAGE